MRLVARCGMSWEKSVLEAALPGALVVQSAGSNPDFAGLVPSDCTHLASMGLAGGLIPVLEVSDFYVAKTLNSGSDTEYGPNLLWSAAVVNLARNAPGPTSGDDVGGNYDMQTPVWGQQCAAVRWFSSGQLDAVDTELQRTALAQKYSVDAIDDESYDVAILAAARGLPFVVARAISDAAGDPGSENLPLAMRGQILSSSGAVDLSGFFAEVAKEPFAQTLDIPAIAWDFNASLATLGAAAPLVLQALL
jgi:hypothetical protein